MSNHKTDPGFAALMSMITNGTLSQCSCDFSEPIYGEPLHLDPISFAQPNSFLEFVASVVRDQSLSSDEKLALLQVAGSVDGAPDMTPVINLYGKSEATATKDGIASDDDDGPADILELAHLVYGLIINANKGGLR